MNITWIWTAFMENPLLLGLSSAIVILFLFLLILLIALCRVSKKVKRMNRNAKNGNLAASIEMYYDKVSALMEKTDHVSKRFEIYEKQNALSLRRTGLVHFNAFGGISGNMSFALAIINDSGDGFILTSLFGHEGSNIYLREVKSGKPTIAISEEEQEALAMALKQ